MNTGWIRIRLGRTPFFKARREWVPVFGCAETGMTAGGYSTWLTSRTAPRAALVVMAA
jgi:hypothetical protein